MAFSGLDDIVSEQAAGKAYRLNFTRLTDAGAASAAGRTHSLFTAGGTGGVFTMTGTPGTGIVFNGSTVGALPMPASVDPDKRHLLSMFAQSPTATLVPATLILTDIIHIYPSCALTGTPSTMSNHPTWTGTGDTRMTSAVGVMCSLLETTAQTAGNGQITITYFDQGGNSVAQPGSMYAPATNTPTGAFWGHANAAVTLGPMFMPLAAGDTGVQRVVSYAVNTGATSGVGAFILHRPIAEVPIVAINVAGERSFLADIGQLPRIHDDACLAFVAVVGGALATSGAVQGSLNMAHG
jgi:hypothetical protein